MKILKALFLGISDSTEQQRMLPEEQMVPRRGVEPICRLN
jgi:hypothetical protein